MEVLERKEFDNLDINKQVEYVNKLLEVEGTLTRVCKSIGIARSTVGGRFTRSGYKYDEVLQKYCKNNTTKDIKKEEAIKPKDVVLQKQDYNNNTFAIQRKLIEIMPMLLEMLDWYKNRKDIEDNTIDVEPIELNLNAKELSGAVSTRSLRCYERAYVEFQKTCSQYQGYKKQDLLSAALLEFAKKYRK